MNQKPFQGVPRLFVVIRLLAVSLAMTATPVPAARADFPAGVGFSGWAALDSENPSYFTNTSATYVNSYQVGGTASYTWPGGAWPSFAWVYGFTTNANAYTTYEFSIGGVDPGPDYCVEGHPTLALGATGYAGVLLVNSATGLYQATFPWPVQVTSVKVAGRGCNAPSYQESWSFVLNLLSVDGYPVATRTPMPPSRPPPHSSSSYIALWDRAADKLDTAALEALGRTEAISETVKGMTDAIVVLHFGYPYRKGSDYGADVLVLDEERLFFASTEDIKKGALEFVKGFCLNSLPTMYLSLALGVNDSVQGIGSGHGQAWARMIDQVSEAIRSDHTLCRPFIGAPPRVFIVGAMDIEPASLMTQSLPIDVIRWAEAYSNTTHSRYYNFGTCSNCPAEPPEQPHTLPSVSPLMDDVWTVSWGIPNAYPLPQIYNVNQLNAYQWYNVKLYGATCASPCRPAQSRQRRMYFPGTFTQYQSCDRIPKPKTCIQTDNSPEEGWRQLFDALDANLITRQVSLRWSTDIAWRTSQP
jgi:hypothetical protein